MTASLSLHDGDTFTVDALTVKDDGTFLLLQAPELSIYLPGYDANAVAAARQLAQVLQAAADALEATLAQPEAV